MYGDADDGGDAAGAGRSGRFGGGKRRWGGFGEDAEGGEDAGGGRDRAEKENGGGVRGESEECASGERWTRHHVDESGEIALPLWPEKVVSDAGEAMGNAVQVDGG